MPDEHIDEQQPTDGQLSDTVLDGVAGGVVGGKLTKPRAPSPHKPLNPAILRGFNPQPEPPHNPNIGH